MAILSLHTLSRPHDSPLPEVYHVSFRAVRRVQPRLGKGNSPPPPPPASSRGFCRPSIVRRGARREFRGVATPLGGIPAPATPPSPPPPARPSVPGVFLVAAAGVSLPTFVVVVYAPCRRRFAPVGASSASYSFHMFSIPSRAARAFSDSAPDAALLPLVRSLSGLLQ